MQGTIESIEQKSAAKGGTYVRVKISGVTYTGFNNKDNPVADTLVKIGAGNPVEFEFKENDKGYKNLTSARPGTQQSTGQPDSCPPPDQVPPAHNGNGRESDEVKAVRISRMNAMTTAANVLAARGFVMDLTTADENGNAITKQVRIPDGNLARCIIALAKRLHHYTMTGEIQE